MPLVVLQAQTLRTAQTLHVEMLVLETLTVADIVEVLACETAVILAEDVPQVSVHSWSILRARQPA